MQAVNAAVDCVEAVRLFSEGKPRNEQIRVSVGIDTGECWELQDTVGAPVAKAFKLGMWFGTRQNHAPRVWPAVLAIPFDAFRMCGLAQLSADVVSWRGLAVLCFGCPALWACMCRGVSSHTALYVLLFVTGNVGPFYPSFPPIPDSAFSLLLVSACTQLSGPRGVTHAHTGEDVASAPDILVTDAVAEALSKDGSWKLEEGTEEEDGEEYHFYRAERIRDSGMLMAVRAGLHI